MFDGGPAAAPPDGIGRVQGLHHGHGSIRARARQARRSAEALLGAARQPHHPRVALASVRRGRSVADRHRRARVAHALLARVPAHRLLAVRGRVDGAEDERDSRGDGTLLQDGAAAQGAPVHPQRDVAVWQSQAGDACGATLHRVLRQAGGPRRAAARSGARAVEATRASQALPAARERHAAQGARGQRTLPARRVHLRL